MSAWKLASQPPPEEDSSLRSVKRGTERSNHFQRVWNTQRSLGGSDTVKNSAGMGLLW